MTRTRINRRAFIKSTSSLLTATAAVPYFMSSSRLLAESKNDRLNIAAIGVGGRGSQIGRWAAELGNMVASCDVDLRRAEQFAASYDGRCQVYQDYRKLPERDDLDAVTVRERKGPSRFLCFTKVASPLMGGQSSSCIWGLAACSMIVRQRHGYKG